jgi:HSP20 family protein
MTLVRFNPFREAQRLPYRVTDLVDGFLNDSPFFAGKGIDKSGLEPVVDIYDNENAIIIEAEMAGIEKENVSVDVDGRILTLKGERKSESTEKKENYYRREREYGTFSRSFTLPAVVDTELIKADFKNGILKIEIPKLAELKAKKITIH